ncbi:helix-turn-helix domain-containing protein [Nocardioides bigeumensis]|jgi:predicted ArsR family transcriptional regulator|uniref:HTH arsR-type domain-containing protein n=1 Tax=Nocardioides bigeumensis TaxID=433657 RepID=A0ABN2YLR0_9ACTN
MTDEHGSRARHIHDPQVLRAIAHPVRNRVLAELTAQGSMRAADVARELDIPANQASFHLRQLAKYGLVEEDPGAARDKRDRVWKASNPSGTTANLKELEASPGGKAASAVFRRNQAEWGRMVVDQALSDRREEGTHTSLTNAALRLTKEESVAMADELTALVDRWSERTRGSTRPRDDSRRTYLYYAVLMPHPGLHLDPDEGERP